MKKFKVRPEPYSAPDRQTWIVRHGHTPFPLDGFADEAREVSALLMEDLATIDFARSNALQDEVHLICESVAAVADAPESSLCFFDAANGQFWIYPADLQPPIEVLEPK